MNIIALDAENIKKLKAVHIRPDGKSVVIGGENEEGKSSCLDCILFALAGEKHLCDEPLRRGAEKGFTKVNLGELIVERRVTKAGTTLVVTNAAGDKKASPQTILDALLGKLTFDPLAFSRMDPKVQRETLAKLVGIDFAPLNDEAKRVYDERTIVNRECDRLKALIVGKAETPGLPEQAVSVEAVMARLNAAREHNRKRDEAFRDFLQAENVEESAKEHTRFCLARVEEQKRLLAEAQAKYEQAKAQEAGALAASKAAEKARDAIIPIEEKPICGELHQLSAKNEAIRSNAELRKLNAEFNAAELRSRAHTSRLDAIQQKKRSMVEEAKFPLSGLTIDDDAVQYEGLPLQQASSARQIKISAAIGMALNPKLRVMIIREGSLLDDRSLAALQDMANSNEFQLWIERVGKGKEISVVIEDGEVAENRL